MFVQSVQQKSSLICFSHSLKMDFGFRYIQFAENKISHIDCFATEKYSTRSIVGSDFFFCTPNRKYCLLFASKTHENLNKIIDTQINVSVKFNPL